MSKKMLILFTLIFIVAIPLLSETPKRVGVLLADWPGCSDIASIVLRETGLLKSFKEDFSDADYILFVNFSQSLPIKMRFDSVAEIKHYLDLFNPSLRLMKMYSDMGHGGSSLRYYVYEVILYEKLSTDRLLEIYRETVH